jgi:Protein of unknown function (DUF3500)
MSTHKHPHDHPHDHTHDHGHEHAGHTHHIPLRKRMALAAHTLSAQYPEALQRLFARAKQELADDFKGITPDGILLPGLFPVKKTGVTLKPLYEAARAFLAQLDHHQRETACLDIGHEGWRGWCNIHPFVMRHGIGLHQLNGAQREAALALVSAALSASGFETARNVMKLNEHALELSGLADEYGEWYYWLSIFGTPSLTEPWGFQLDGHHLIINCFVYGDQMVLTPTFMGSEPVYARSGKYAGAKVFRAEESMGLAMMRGLTAAQQTQAIIGDKLPGELLTAAFRDNERIAYEGIRYSDLSRAQQAALVDLVGVYIHRMRPGHAEIRMDEVRAHLGQTHFSWIGGHDDIQPFYYRVYNPVVLIEFDHQPGVLYDNSEPSREHIHTIVRTPNGNDYGKDLLRQHYEHHDHSNPHTAHRQGKA